MTPGGPWAWTSNPWGPRGPEVRLLPAGVPLLPLPLLWLLPLLALLLPHPCCLVIGRSQRCCSPASSCRLPCTVVAARTIVAFARSSLPGTYDVLTRFVERHSQSSNLGKKWFAHSGEDHATERPKRWKKHITLGNPNQQGSCT